MSERFKTAPSKTYLDAISDFLLDHYKFDEIKLILKVIPNEYDSIPSLREMKKVCEKVIGNMNIKNVIKIDDKPWMSVQAPGTPANFECVFNWIKDGKVGCKGWDVALRHIKSSGLSEEDIWQAYETWINGQVHEKIRNLRQKPIGGI